MNILKKDMNQAQEEIFEKKIVAVLGISHDEMSELQYEMDTEESNDGLVYNYIIQFSSNNQKEILNKIQGLDANNQVWIGAGVFSNL